MDDILNDLMDKALRSKEAREAAIQYIRCHYPSLNKLLLICYTGGFKATTEGNNFEYPYNFKHDEIEKDAADDFSAFINNWCCGQR